MLTAGRKRSSSSSAPRPIALAMERAVAGITWDNPRARAGDCARGSKLLSWRMSPREEERIDAKARGLGGDQIGVGRRVAERAGGTGQVVQRRGATGGEQALAGRHRRVVGAQVAQGDTERVQARGISGEARPQIIEFPARPPRAGPGPRAPRRAARLRRRLTRGSNWPRPHPHCRARPSAPRRPAEAPAVPHPPRARRQRQAQRATPSPVGRSNRRGRRPPRPASALAPRPGGRRAPAPCRSKTGLRRAVEGRPLVGEAHRPRRGLGGDGRPGRQSIVVAIVAKKREAGAEGRDLAGWGVGVRGGDRLIALGGIAVTLGILHEMGGSVACVGCQRMGGIAGCMSSKAARAALSRPWRARASAR